MKRSDEYHKRVERSDEDNAYVGKCPDLVTGIHGEARAFNEPLSCLGNDGGGAVGCGTLCPS